VPPFRDRAGWYLGLSAFWFANSAKWYILLLAILPGQVEAIVPGGEKNSQWGMVFAIGAIWATIGPALFGHLSDRYGLRRGSRGPFIAIGAGLTVMALMFLMQASEMWMLVLGYLLLQISDDVGTGPYSALIPELVPEDRRGKASGFMGMLELLAQITIALIGLALGNPKLIYVALAAFNVICALIVLATIRGATPLRAAGAAGTQQQPEQTGGFFSGWLRPWKSRDFRWVWGTRFLGALGIYMIQPYLRFYLTDSVQTFELLGRTITTDAGQATIILGMVISLSGALGALWAARVSDTWGKKRVIIAAGSLMFLIMVPFALIPNFTLIFVLALFFGFGYGAYLSGGWALAASVVPSHHELGKDMGLWQMSYSSVQIFAGSAGMLIKWGNETHPGRGYTITFLLASGIFLLSTLLVRQVGEGVSAPHRLRRLG